MADFVIWGKVHEVASNEFVIVASAVAAAGGDASVLTAAASTLDIAESERARLMVQLGQVVRARGDTIVDVEED